MVFARVAVLAPAVRFAVTKSHSIAAGSTSVSLPSPGSVKVGPVQGILWTRVRHATGGKICPSLFQSGILGDIWPSSVPEYRILISFIVWQIL